MTARDIPLDSDALRANIAGTAQDVIIPARYAPLLDAVEGYHGVREPLRETLTEYFHRFRNVDAVVDGLQVVLLRNWSYFDRSPQRGRLFELLTELVVGLLSGPVTREQASALLRQLFTWFGEALRAPYGPEHLPAVSRTAEALATLVGDHQVAFLERDSALHRLLEQLHTLSNDCASAGATEAVTPWAELYSDVLALGYARVAERFDIGSWAIGSEAHLNYPQAVVEVFPMTAPSATQPLWERVSAKPVDVPELLRLPDLSEILDEAIRAIFRVDDLEDRFSVCLFFLKDNTLGYRQHEVMVDLLAVVKAMVEPARRADFNRLLDRLTSFFHRREGLFPEMRFQIYEAVGVAIGEAGATRAADHLIDDLLRWRFEYPDIQGSTDEWRTLVNPYHLPNVRCWMHIIESNPTVYERLAAALNAQLRAGGVFIADTDLFQRDISRFLNADVKPIYFVAKQLLRAFPVYFNEVGAEGELRSVSTEIDEICGRKDTLMHFLRKQAHAESSNRLVEFSAAVLDYWRTLDVAVLEPFLSQNTLAAVAAERAMALGPHEVLSRGNGGEAPAGDGRPGAVDRRRVWLMKRLHELLAQKYCLLDADLPARVEAQLQLPEDVRRRFTEALSEWLAARQTGEDDQIRQADALTPLGVTTAARDHLLDTTLDVLCELKTVILAPASSAGVESIYHKRHIAAGIPSMYGNYTEPKFDALGLSFRVERLLARLLEEAVDTVTTGGTAHARHVLPERGLYVTRASLRRMARSLRRFARALDVDGVHSQHLSSSIGLLEAGLTRESFTFAQFRNVFQFLTQSVSELARMSVLSHDQALRTILDVDPRQHERRGLTADALAEVILRDVLVSAVGLQTLDRYLGAAFNRIASLADRLEGEDLTRIMTYDPDRLISWIHEPDSDTDDEVTLGYKALGLKRLVQYGYRVPQGFVLTTELFSVLPVLSYKPLYDDTIARLRAAVMRLEEQTGLRLGDPKRPLTLSIRSGAAISMPGLMMTFINVGLNQPVVEALAARPGAAWTAWDSYRRFLQSWAMSAGVERDVFDAVIASFKTRYGVTQKSQLTARQMRGVALEYARRARELGVVLVEDPFQQIVTCVRKVLDSWDAPQARFYREYTGVAEEWGTAVIVQRMVLGNLSDSSGAGVTFTRNPLEPHSRQVRLFGDFAVRTQGEDLVGGLVFPLPVSEAQRRASPTYRGVDSSLETLFPKIYGALLAAAEDLVHAREHDPQEIEFTFESPSADDLYLLQKRPMVESSADDTPIFDTLHCEQCDLPAAVGMGVAGGAYSGRVAVDAAQIDRLLAEDSRARIVLLRPDTVPEDLTMIVRVEGILTARGGSTSHAAVTAKRLGKTAVVDCRALEVDETTGTARLAGHQLYPGDWLSIDGRTGHIFLGRLPILEQARHLPGPGPAPTDSDKEGSTT